jgi:hypothetical protein
MLYARLGRTDTFCLFAVVAGSVSCLSLLDRSTTSVSVFRPNYALSPRGTDLDVFADTKSQEQAPAKPAQGNSETPRPSTVTAGQTPGLSYGQQFDRPRQ